jgi:regulator of protease activity HflC (stomatin/prohibitin superfamily)
MEYFLFWLVVVAVISAFVFPSIRRIGPTQVGLVTKRFSFRKLSGDNPIALNGEAGYQADLLMPGWRWKFRVVNRVDKHPWVQVPAGQIGVVIAQAGSPVPIGAKSAIYRNEFGIFADLRQFLAHGGQKGVQRPVLSPGTLVPLHPVGFLVITKQKVFGVPISRDLRDQADEFFGLKPEQLEVVHIEPEPSREGTMRDMVGIITSYEGEPLPAGDIASRLGGFDDIRQMEKANGTDLDEGELIELVLGSKNDKHNNYQDFQAFLEAGGKMGLQHDPLLYGAYNLNPFLIKVEKAPMLVVEQGEVAVIKAYVGLPMEDTSGEAFKFGMLARPGHRGIWQEPLRTGKYPINPHCYQWEIVPTCILTLNWADAVSKAHNLDASLEQIEAKSCEGFVFKLDLQVQIHVPDTQAPKVISMVGTMQNLVSEVLQAAVGNHFRDKLQSMHAVKFIETRQLVQEEAFVHIKAKLDDYSVETKGVYIQDVILPQQLVDVLTAREIANQEIETFQKQREAQDQRIATEKAKGTADMQASLAKSEVEITINENNARARKAQAEGEASYIAQVGNAEASKTRAIGMANAEAYKGQVDALGQMPTALVNSIRVLAEQKIKIMPDILVTGGGEGGLSAVLMGLLKAQIPPAPVVATVTPAVPVAPAPYPAK